MLSWTLSINYFPLIADLEKILHLGSKVKWKRHRSKNKKQRMSNERSENSGKNTIKKKEKNDLINDMHVLYK